MKTKDIVRKFNFNQAEFDNFIKQSNYKWTQNFLLDVSIDEEEDISSIIKEYRVYNANKMAEEASRKKRELEEQMLAQKEEAEKRKALSQMLITSGFSFDGYKITKYSGYISGDDAISVDRGWAVFGSGGTNVKDKLMDSLVTIRRNALNELKEAAYDLGCNAVIGVDFDYLTLDPQTANLGGGTTYQPYVFGVTANGNAVIIERIEEE